MPHPRAAQPAVAIDDQAAAEEHFFGVAGEFPTFVQVVVGAMVGVGAAVGEFSGGVPDGNVGVGTREERAFAGVEAKDFGGVGAAEGDELIGGDAPCAHTVCPHDGQAVAHAGQAVGNFGEVVRPQLFAGDGNLFAFIGDRLGPIEKEGAVVGAEDVQGAIPQRLPDAGMIGFAAHGGGADPFGSVGAGEVFFGEEEVGGAGFAHDGDAAGAGVGQLVYAAGGVHVDDVKGGLRLRCQACAAQYRVHRTPGRTGASMPDGRGVACRQRLVDEHFNHVSIFRVEHGEHAIFFGNLHYAEDFAILQAEDAVVGGEDFEGGDAEVEQAGDFGFHFGGEGGNVHVEAKVDGGKGVGFGVPVFDVGGEGGQVLGDEVHDSGGPAEGCRFVAGVVVIGGDGAEHGEGEVDVGIDAARHDEFARGVNDFGIGGVQICADGGYFFAGDEDVGAVGFGSGDEGARFDEGGHGGVTGYWLLNVSKLRIEQWRP